MDEVFLADSPPCRAASLVDFEAEYVGKRPKDGHGAVVVRHAVGDVAEAEPVFAIAPAQPAEQSPSIRKSIGPDPGSAPIRNQAA